MRVRQLAGIASLAAIGAAAWAGVTIWNAARRVPRHNVPHSASSLTHWPASRSQPRTRNAPVEVLASGDLASDGISFAGKLYLAGNGGVAEYLADGSPGRRFRPGVELPPAPVTALAAGVLPNSSGRELLIATNGEGLIVFDGSRLWQMRPQDAAARKVTALLPTASGRLLLGTESAGVLAYDGRQLQAFHPSLAHLHVTALAGDAADLWVGTLDQGVVHWHAGQVERWNLSNGLPDAQVLAIHAAGDLVFVGTPMGVAAFRAGPVRSRIGARRIRQHAAAARARPSDRHVRRRRDSRASGSAPGAAGCVRARFDGCFGAASVRIGRRGIRADGFRIAPTSRRRQLGAGGSQPQSGQLTNANISALAVDSAGRLWVGYFDRGLDIVDAGRVTHLEDDTLFCINRIAADAETHRMAVATANGLVMFDASGRVRQVLAPARWAAGGSRDGCTLRRRGTTVAATPAGLTVLRRHRHTERVRFSRPGEQPRVCAGRRWRCAVGGNARRAFRAFARRGDGQLHHREFAAET